MMRLTLQRRAPESTCTIGQLSVDGVSFCDTLEDLVREVPGIPVAKWKVAGETAIPCGAYLVQLTVSERARRGHLWTPRADGVLPQLMNVEGFEGIRIHAGNTALNVEGCIAVGVWDGGESVHGSRAAFVALMERLEQAAAEGHEVYIEVRNP